MIRRVIQFNSRIYSSLSFGSLMGAAIITAVVLCFLRGWAAALIPISCYLLALFASHFFGVFLHASEQRDDKFKNDAD